MDSLDRRYENIYVKKSYEELRSLSQSEPSLKMIGQSSDYEPSCNCLSPSWYMLYSDHTVHESPVVCGDCRKTVPLYKLPKILGEEEYFTVLGWQRAYNACDELFMEGIGERAAYRRLSNVLSDLSVQGREICKAFEKAAGKPFYYYLFRYYSPHKDHCPICGEYWKLGEGNQLYIDYRCEIAD